MNVAFTVYDPNTNEVLRSGACPQELVALQAQPGEAVLEGVRANDITDRIVAPVNGAAPYVRKRAAAEIETRTPKYPDSRVDQSAILIEALKAKGVSLSAADLQAARATLEAQRSVKPKS